MGGDPTIDLKTAQRFLDALEGPDARHTFQTYDDVETDGKRREGKTLVRILHGTLAECADELLDLHAKGAGVFVCVNRTDLRGRKAGNVVALRANYIDVDDAPQPDEFPVEPNIITSRSPTRWHAFWLLKDGESLRGFRSAQEHLIAFYGSDPKVKDLPRVMRIPGFPHQKGDPVPFRLVKCDPELRRPMGLVVAKHQLSGSTPNGRAERRRKEGRPAPQDKYVAKALRDEVDRVRMASDGSRNTTLNEAAFNLGQLVGGGCLDEATIVAELLDAAGAAGLGEAEARKTIGSGLEAGRKEPRTPPEQIGADAIVKRSGLLDLPKDDSPVDIEAALLRFGAEAVRATPVARNVAVDIAKKALKRLGVSGPKQLVDAAIEQASRESRRAPDPHPTDGVVDAGEYRERPDGIYRVTYRGREEREIEVRLTNFRARIVSDVVRDDGVETTNAIEVEAHLGRRVERAVIPAARYPGMTWVVEHLGSGAVVEPGNGVRDHARAAIQKLSGSMPRRRVYTHTGWRRIDGEWVYLHAAGAIGKDGPVPGVETDLGDLGDYELPEPPTGSKLRKAVLASVSILDVAPDRITAPLLAFVYRAVVGAADFCGHLSGPTGSGKTELAALGAQHYGARMNSRNLPGSWSSTANALEGQAFLAKDALFVVDDFAPSGSPRDVARAHQQGDRYARAQGNLSARGRLRPDGTLRPARGPRGLSLSTGEDTIRNHSGQARLMTIDVAGHDLDWERMTGLQDLAARGLFASALAAYVKWLAPRHDRAVRWTARATRRVRSLLRRSDGGRETWHGRTFSTIAELMAGVLVFLRFAASTDALRARERRALRQRLWAALVETAKRHEDDVGTANPVHRFLELLRSAIGSGIAHVATVDGEDPARPATWGWRGYVVGKPGFAKEVWKEQGARVGWLDKDDLYLDPHAALKAAQTAAGPDGEGISIQPKTLGKQLRHKGFFVSCRRDRNTSRTTVQGARREVWHLRASTIAPEERDDPELEGDDSAGDSEDPGAVSAQQEPASHAGSDPSRDDRDDFPGGIHGKSREVERL